MVSRCCHLCYVVGIEKEELALKVLPYLDPNNKFVDDEPCVHLSGNLTIESFADIRSRQIV